MLAMMAKEMRKDAGSSVWSSMTPFSNEIKRWNDNGGQHAPQTLSVLFPALFFVFLPTAPAFNLTLDDIPSWALSGLLSDCPPQRRQRKLANVAKDEEERKFDESRMNVCGRL